MDKIRIRARFDYVAEGKAGHRFFGSKSGEEQAEEMRQQKITLLRNVPVQGIYIEDIDVNQEVYTIFDEVSGKPAAYAPVNITFKADAIEDAVKFIMKEEFRTVEIIEPAELTMTRLDMERLFLKVSEGLHSYRSYLERKLDNWK